MKTIRWSSVLLPIALSLTAACADTGGDEAPADAGVTPVLPGAGGDGGTSVPVSNAVDAGGTSAAPDAGLLGLLPGLGIALPPALGGGAAPVDAGTSAPSVPGQTYAGPGKPKCVRKESQLMVVGDSYISWFSHTFPDDIARESGQRWRMLAIGGYSMATGGLGSIPNQFYDGIAADPDAHTMLLDGGGNDILLADGLRAPIPNQCTTTGCSKDPACIEIVRLALAKAGTLMVEAADKGIRDVVYFFYPHVPANTILSGNNPTEMVDYALPIARKTCEDAIQTTTGRLRCTFVDLIPLFEGHKDWFNEDIHENSKGSAAMASHIWKIMSASCIGQKPSAGCCE